MLNETVYLFGQPIAVLKGTDVFNVHTDHLGSPRKITNQAGAAIWSWAEKPFGDSPVNQDPDGDGIVFEYNLRFPGQFFDSETGLHYNYHRYYDSQTGRYITSDPIGLSGGLNTYGYVENNPLKYIDSLGLLVNAVLDTSTNTLTVTDIDTGESVTATAFTGGQVEDDGSITSPGFGKQIPAPYGDYIITDNPNYRSDHPDWFGLLKLDERINDYFYENGKRRGGARLHGGEVSHGCLTVNTHDGKDSWNKVFNLIKSTKTGVTSFDKGYYPWSPEGTITLYGFVQIR